MTKYELLKANQSLLYVMERNGIMLKDVSMLQMIDEAERMEREGEKKQYIVSVLAEKYKVSVRSVYSTLTRLREAVMF